METREFLEEREPLVQGPRPGVHYKGEVRLRTLRGYPSPHGLVLTLWGLQSAKAQLALSR